MRVPSVALDVVAECFAANPHVAVQMTIGPQQALQSLRPHLAPNEYAELAQSPEALLALAERMLSQPSQPPNTSQSAIERGGSANRSGQGNSTPEALNYPTALSATLAQASTEMGPTTSRDPIHTAESYTTSHLQNPLTPPPVGHSNPKPIPTGLGSIAAMQVNASDIELILRDKGVPYMTQTVSRGETILTRVPSHAIQVTSDNVVTTPITAELTTPPLWTLLRDEIIPEEAQLFVRDPDEIASALDKLPTNPVDVDQQIANLITEFHAPQGEWNLPEVLSLLSPGAPPPPPPIETAIAPDPFQHGVIPFDFLEIPTNPVTGMPEATPSIGPLVPTPVGIRALKLQNAGACTHEIHINDVASGFGSLIANLCDKIDRIDLHRAVIVPVIRSPFSARERVLRDQWALQSDLTHRGQIFINADFSLEQSGFGCSMQVSLIYDINLDSNGAVVLTPANLRMGEISVEGGGGAFLGPTQADWSDMIRTHAYAGGGCDDFVAQLGSQSLIKLAMGVILPPIINQNLHLLLSLRQVQQVFGDMGCDPTLGPRFDAYKMGFAHFAPNSSNGQKCLFARSSLCDRIRLGFVMAGHAPNGKARGCLANSSPNDDEKHLQRMFAAINAIDPLTGTFRFWTCATNCSPSDNQNIGLLAFQSLDWWSPPNFKPSCNPNAGHCDFVPPVKRMIMNPDSIQLVYFEEFDEWDNAALAAYYATYGFTAGDVSSMCNYAKPTTGIAFKRPYALVRLSPTSCAKQSD